MGLKTWNSLPAAALPFTGRTNIVIARQVDWTASGALVVGCPEEATALDILSAGGDMVWVISGGDVYRQAMSEATVAVRTVVEDDSNEDPLPHRTPRSQLNHSCAGTFIPPYT